MNRWILFILLVPCIAAAEMIPRAGDFDPRVRVVDYNPSDVIRLRTYFGVSTHVQFGEDELIKEVAMGDELAWAVISRGNHLFIKPKAPKADTNVTVVTSKRVYQFALVVEPLMRSSDKSWQDANITYSLSFRYPQEAAAAVAALAGAATERQTQANIQKKLARANNSPTNFDYWAAGSEDVIPSAASDDGRFIRLSFGANRDMPAIYIIDSDGKEALVNTSVEGHDILVQRLARRLVLRKGEATACIVNRSFSIDGAKDNATGTIAPDVLRVIKGGN